MPNRKTERVVVTRINKEYKGEIEVLTPVGKIDILTKSKVIEVKTVALWKSALGQVLAYSFYHKRKKKVLYLFGALDCINCVEIVRVCSKYNVEVVFDKLNVKRKVKPNSKQPTARISNK